MTAPTAFRGESTLSPRLKQIFFRLSFYHALMHTYRPPTHPASLSGHAYMNTHHTASSRRKTEAFYYNSMELLLTSKTRTKVFLKVRACMQRGWGGCVQQGGQEACMQQGRGRSGSGGAGVHAFGRRPRPDKCMPACPPAAQMYAGEVTLSITAGTVVNVEGQWGVIITLETAPRSR